MDSAKQHAAAVTSILNAVNAYADWAPLPDLSKYGIIHGYLIYFNILSIVICDFDIDIYGFCPPSCSFLLSAPDFRLHACDFFKLVSSRYVL